MGDGAKWRIKAIIIVTFASLSVVNFHVVVLCAYLEDCFSKWVTNWLTRSRRPPRSTWRRRRRRWRSIQHREQKPTRSFHSRCAARHGNARNKKLSTLASKYVNLYKQMYTKKRSVPDVEKSPEHMRVRDLRFNPSSYLWSTQRMNESAPDVKVLQQFR